GAGAGCGAAGCWVEVAGLGYPATAFGMDVVVPGDAEPVAGSAAGGEFAGLDPVVDDPNAAVQPFGGAGDADLAGGVRRRSRDVVGVSDPLDGLDVERTPVAGGQAGGVEQVGELIGGGGRAKADHHLDRRRGAAPGGSGVDRAC